MCQCEASGLNARIRPQMAKDTRLSFRAESSLKEQLEQIAKDEGRSLAQVCEAFLRAGCESYRKEGTKILKQFLSRNRRST